MPKLSADQALAMPLELDVGGRIMKVPPITFGDLAAYEAHLRSERLRDTQTDIERYSPEAQSKIALALSAGVFTLDDLFTHIGTPSGSMWMLRRLVARGNPAMCGEDGALNGFDIPPLDGVKLMGQVLVLSGLADPKPPEEAPAATEDRSPPPTGAQ